MSMSKKPSKKSKQLVKINSKPVENDSKANLSAKIANSKKKIAETDSKIAEGLVKSTASTGTLMSDLKGDAKFMAQLANIGGGSLATGGGGIRDGFNTIMINVAEKNFINNIDTSTTKSVGCDSPERFLEKDNKSE